MESSITLHIHHGGEFAEKNGVKYYKGGKVEYAYNMRLDVLSIPMFENYIRTDLGYKEFKIYWLSGSLFSDSNCKLLWNDDSLEQMIAYALKSDRIDVYVDHSCEIEEGEGSDDSEKEDGSEDNSVEDSDSESEKEDGSEDEDYNCNLSDCDDDWDEVMQKKKENQLNCKNKQVMEEDGKGFESEYDSDSFEIVGEEISDSSDDDIADSVGTKKKVRKVSKKVYPSFNTRTPMKNIEFEIGLIFTDVKTLRNAIIDYMVEQKREIWFKKNDLQRLQAKCRENCPWYLFVSKVDETGAFQVKTYNKHHNCILVHKHKLVTSDWLVRKIGSKVRANPKWKLREIQQHVHELYGYTLMTDQQKGLKHAIDNILPRAEHSDLLKTEPRYWSRAFFDILTKCDMVDNNLSECFNSWIVEARYKPILDLLDDIRLQVMERLYKKRDWMKGVDSTLFPRIVKKLNYSIEGTRSSTWAGGDECEVRDIDGVNGWWIWLR
ncbi:hypothetical protein POM88_039420 [Heracleum sosnowskyi]|uniref:Transposase MuDR plant domain-containing protein n=1 Tax=Heracleum sosnowskyi TaxID=360622 RepID=A0AAD8M8Q4_9APIA|nr:hypothetical protein POM88_039420 [Heracleum sosnowskyi]